MKRKRLLLTCLILLTFVGILSTSTVIGQTTLKHSYKFEDGTAKDGTGNAHGLLVGDATVSNGKLTLSGTGFVGLPGKLMNIAQYESLTIEVVFSQASTTGGYSMVYSFGRTNLDPGWPMGVDYLFYQPTRSGDNDCRAAISCLNYSNPWETETRINSPKIADTDKHYVVTVFTPTDMTLYIDGAFRGTVALEGNNVLANVSNDTAYIGWSIYSNDNKWKGSVYEMNIYEGAMEATTIADRTEGFLGIPVAEASLSSITSNKGDFSPAFDAQTTNYDLTLEYGTTQVNLSAQPTVKGATVKMFDGLGNEITDGIVNITGDGVDIKFEVTALNGFSKKNYFVSTYYYPEEDAASLSAIQLSKGTLGQAFDADNTYYTVLVPYGTTSVEVTGVPVSDKEKVEGDGTINLTNGEGTASIVVTSENEKYTKIYTVKISASKVTTGKYYYLIHEKSGLAATESQEGYDIVKLTHPVFEESSQIFEFVASGVNNQYFIKNLLTNYLTHSSSSTWDLLMSPELSSDLDSNRFALHEFEPGRFRIESIVKDGADGRFIGTNDENVDTWVYNDKWIDNTLAIWNIVPQDDAVSPYDTYLSELTIDKVPLSPEFDRYTTDYYITLPIGTTSLNVAATASDENATVSGAGDIAISGDNGVIIITVTASDADYKSEYKIHYQMDTPLTLTHSYTFADGTAQDQVGDADGLVVGGTITSGVYTTGSQGEYIKLPASKIALNSYPSITIEAYVKTGENPGCTMFAYFGGLNGVNTYWMTLAGCGDFSKAVINQGSEYGAEGPEAAAGENHHYVSVLTNDTIWLYVDGSLAAKSAIGSTYVINKISLENAFLCKSGYNDPTWLGSIYEFNIYSGQMDEQTIAQRAGNFPVEDIQSDATLSDLKVDGSTIKDFDPAVLNYSLTLPKTTTTVPTITATPKYANAALVVTKANGIPGTTKVVVTAEDGSTKNTYFVVFKHPASNDAALADIKVDGTSVSDFNANTKVYTINLSGEPSAVPTVTAVSHDENATVAISPAVSLPGTTKIVVTAEDQVTTKTYFVSFKITVDVAETEITNIQVLPTIFSDNFKVKTNGTNTTISVFDVTGKTVVVKNNVTDEVTISVPNAGIYLVKVNQGDKFKTFKVIKNQ